MELQENEILPGTLNLMLTAEEEGWRWAAEIMIRFLEPSEGKT